VVPRAGLELATTSLIVDLGDLEDFRLFAQAKLNLSKVTVAHYLRRVKAFLRGRSFVTDRDIDVFQGRAPKNVLAKHYNPHGIRMLKEIYDKANLKFMK
jgi:hypothetical protein